MDTTKIKALLLAVKYKSLSKAAERFSYTPSALSHSVDSLEEALCVKLLNRTHSGVELTEAGEQLLEKLSAVVQAENELFQSASAIATRQKNRLRIGTYTSVSVNLLPELLKEFKECHPEVSISISVGDHIGDWLHKDLADVLLGLRYEDLSWLPIAKDDFVAVVPETLFEDRAEISFEDLYPHAFITTKNMDVERKLDLGRFKELVKLSSDDDMSAVSMVQKGMGVTILPALVVKNQPKGIRVLQLKECFCRTLGIGYKPDLLPDSGAMKFIQYLKRKQRESL